MTLQTSQSVETVSVGRPVWPIIPLNAGEVTVGRASTCTVPIQHASISRVHLKLLKSAAGVEIEDLDSRFGTFVNGTRIKKTILKLGDSVRIGSSPPYRFTGDILEAVVDGSGVAMRLADVGVEREGRRLIGGINLTLRPDTFVGVLGPSGAGKSVLLSVLNSTVAPTTGVIEFDDGVPLKDNLPYFRSKLGIVTQDDLVYTDLTVEENLQLAAMVRMPDVSPDSLKRRVDAALESVGLLEHRIKRVGVLSGGQRKRVSVAVEMLMQPRLILLDEPTSGLDPGMQARLMEMLRGLARRGVTVVCTTHTLDTMNFFDQVIVLGLTGRVASVVYQGDPRQLLPAFGVGSQADLFDKLQELAGAAPATTATKSISGAPEPAAAEADSADTASRQRPRFLPIPPTEPGAKRIWQQAQVVFKRSAIGLLRDKASTLLAIAQPPFLALLIILAQSNQKASVGLLFFSVLCSIWLGLTLTVREIVRERKLYIRDRLAGLHPDGYLLGKMLYAGAITAGQTFLLWFFIRFIGPTIIDDDAASKLRDTSVIMGFIILLLTGVGSTMLGLILSTWCTTERAAITFMPLVLLPQVLLSRVIYGDAGWKKWSDPSPFMPFISLVHGDSVADNDNDTKKATKRIIGLMSMPMLTRPGTAALDMMHSETTAYVFSEFIYLILVVSGYGVVLWVVFRRLERTWNDIR